MQTDGVETENRLYCKKCKVTLSRSDSFARHLQSEGHMRSEVRKVKLGRPTKDAERKKAEKREKKARER